MNVLHHGKELTNHQNATKSIQCQYAAAFDDTLLYLKVKPYMLF